MTGKTHLAAGIFTGVLLSEMAPEIEGKGIILASAVLGSILPDADIEHSIVNQKVKVTKALALICKHRGVFHTPFVFFLIALPVYIFLNRFAGLAFFAGAMSHLLLDSFNRTGIMLLYPFSSNYHRFAKIKTGGVVDLLICVTMIAASAYLVCAKGF